MAQLSQRGLNLGLEKRPIGKPSLLLDFANTKVLDPKIDFTRNSKATRVNEFGLIEEVAANVPRFDHDPVTLESKGLLIEESRTNLLTHSNRFENSAWIKTRSSIIPNAAVAPDGSLTASKLIEDASNGTHFLQFTHSFVSGVYYTSSFFVKAAERTHVSIWFTSNIGGTNSVNVNLAKGSFNHNGAIGTIVKYPNGYYRVSSTILATETVVSNIVILLHNGSTTSYQGNGTSGIYIWNVQLEEGSFPTSIMPSTESFVSRASTATYIGSDGLIKIAAINEERLSYNPSNLNVAPKKLLEVEKTNLLLRSNNFSDGYWTKSRLTIGGNSISPTGENDAQIVIDNTENDIHYLQRNVTKATEPRVYTGSIYIKQKVFSKVFISLTDSTTTNRVFVIFDLSTKTIVQETSQGTFKFINAGMSQESRGWFRVSLTASTGSEALVSFQLRPTNYSDNQTTYVGENSECFEIYGAQLEEGYLTSYIPTVASTVTRSADVYTSMARTRDTEKVSITGTNFSSWYNQGEGTFITKTASLYNGLQPGKYPFILSVSDGTLGNRITLLNSQVNAPPTVRFEISYNGVFQGTLAGGIVELGKEYSVATAYKLYSVAMSRDGSVAVTSPYRVPPTNRLDIGSRTDNNVLMMYSGVISQIVYYPRRLTDSEIQEITV